MKVLWFTNTPCGASGRLTSQSISSSWLSSLESVLKKNSNIELHVAFYYKENINDFIYEGVYYHPIYDNRNKSKLKILINNYREYFFGPRNHNIKNLLAVVYKVKPNLIHYHGTECEFGLLQKEFTNIPSVISLQGVLNSCYEKLYSGICSSIISRNESIISKLTCQTIKMSEKRIAHGAIRELDILNISKNIIGRTDFDYHASLAISPNATYYKGNEILREEFYLSKWEKTTFNSQLTIATTISSGFYKGLEVILRTAINLNRINFKFKWIVIGQTENSRDAMIISKYLNQKFSLNNIEMVGRKNAIEIVNILKQADLYCQTSHIENSPNSVCEAMLIGMPIIASYAGGTSSILENNKEGYLLQDGDSFSSAGAIIVLSKDFSKAQSWGINARKRALVRHNPERVAEEYYNIYQKILLRK